MGFLLDSPDGCVLAVVKEEEVKRTIVKFDQHTQNEMHIHTAAWNSCVYYRLEIKGALYEVHIWCKKERLHSSSKI